MPDPLDLAELHVHLEGTVRPETAAELAAVNGISAPPAYRYSDLGGFLAIYADVCACMRTAADFERVILEHASSMAEQRIVYAEISINPSMHPGDAWLDGLIGGRRQALAGQGVEIAWLVELVRTAPPDANRRALDIALHLEGCVGLGLVGDEAIGAAPLAPLLDSARAAGLRFMPHAGQSGRPQAVREAVEVLHAERIAHGVGALADPELLEEVARLGTCLCVCPSSNHAIGMRPDYRKLAEAGIPVTVNSDDPAMVGTSLTRELELAETRHGLDRAALIAAAWRHRFGPASQPAH